jgi:hypothetical protein
MQGELDIRIPLDAGIAGWVATHGKLLNIPDAYEVLLCFHLRWILPLHSLSRCVCGCVR